MLPKTHTEFTVKIKPVGQRSYKKTYLFKNILIDDIEELDEYISWGCDGNWIIKEAVDIAKYNILDDYRIISLINLSDSDLGIRWALENSNRVEKLRKKQFIKNTTHLFYNGWIKPNGEFIKIDYDQFHIDYAEWYIYDNDLKDDFYKEHDKHFSMSQSDYMEKILGWVRVQGRRNTLGNASFSKITNAQMRTLLELCFKYDKSFKEVVYHSEWAWQKELEFKRNKKL